MSDPRLESEAPPTAIPGPEHPTPTAATLSNGAEAKVPVPPGYEILCELGEGGMGVVYRALDCALNRSVALKYLKGDFHGDSRVTGRFSHESGITARLQHPGIPPVYQVGTLSDGRPFLAMKLIEGRTLHEELMQKGPGAGKWLAVFESICQAVGYAHSQGVIHRDLKPANVMVGAFGEVQVMDWGLAKVLASGGRQPPEPTTVSDDEIPETRPPESDEWLTPGLEATRAGSIMGTPAFMPPEQAIGAIDRVDRRSDVFGLGAILCALLTGKPPYVGPDGESTRQLAARAKLDDAFARLDGCGAEPDLVALAKRCLAVEPEERFADGGELAAAVAELRRASEERARQAELDRVRDAVQAEERAKQAAMEKAHALEQAERQRQHRKRNQRVGGALIGVLLAGIVGTSLGAYWADQNRSAAVEAEGEADAKRAEAVKAREDEAAQRVKAELARKEEAKARIAADQATALARKRASLAGDALNDTVIGIQEALKSIPDKQKFSTQLMRNAQKGLSELLREGAKESNPDRTLAMAHLRLGDIEQILGNTKDAHVEYQAGHKLALRLEKDDPKNAQAQRDLSISYGKLGDVTLRLGQTKEALDHFQKSLDVRLRLVRDDPKNAKAPRDLSVSYEKLGDVTLQLGQTKEALDFFQKSLDGRLQLTKDDPKNPQAQRDLSVSYGKLGNVTLQLGQTKEALDHYQKSHDVLVRLAKDDPKNATAQRDLSVSYNNLGDVTLRLGQAKEALDHFQKSHEVLLPLAKDDPKNATAQRDLSSSYINLGDATLRLGQTKEALDHFQKSHEVLLPLTKDDPKNAQAQRDLSISYNKLGDVTLRLGQTKEALDFYQKSLDVRLRLAKDDPKNAQAQRDLGVSYVKLADVTLQLGQTKEALDSYQKSHEVGLRRVKEEPKNAQAQTDLSLTCERLGAVTLQLGQTKEALDFFQKSLDVRLRLTTDDPKNATAQRDLSISHNNLGDVTLRLGQTKEALDHFQKSHEISLRLAKNDPKNAQAQRDLSICYNNLGNVTLKLGQTKEALDFFQKYHDLCLRLARDDPKNAQAQRDLFISYWKLGSVEKTRHDYARAAECFAEGRKVLLPWHEKKLLVGQFKNAIASIDRELSFCKNAEKVIANLSFILAQQPDQFGPLLDLRVRALLHRGHLGEAIRTAECWRDHARRVETDRDAFRYDAACALALCAAADQGTRRDLLVRKCVGVLTKLRESGVFKNAKSLATFEQDKDFAGIRKHADFARFADSLRKK